MESKSRVEDLLLADLKKRINGGAWVREYQPCPVRRWRIDIALPDERLSIEVEGQRFHSSAAQRRKDSEKNNYLEMNGWTCFRYPASSVLNNKRRALIVEQIARTLFRADADDAFDANILTGDL